MDLPTLGRPAMVIIADFVVIFQSPLSRLILADGLGQMASSLRAHLLLFLRPRPDGHSPADAAWSGWSRYPTSRLGWNGRIPSPGQSARSREMAHIPQRHQSGLRVLKVASQSVGSSPGDELEHGEATARPWRLSMWRLSRLTTWIPASSVTRTLISQGTLMPSASRTALMQVRMILLMANFCRARAAQIQC